MDFLSSIDFFVIAFESVQASDVHSCLVQKDVEDTDKWDKSEEM